MILCCIHLGTAACTIWFLATETCECLDVDWAESFHQDGGLSDTFVDDVVINDHIYGHLPLKTEAVETIQ